MPRTISELILEYFKNHPKEHIHHGPVVDWVTAEYLKEHETPPRDVWRAIRLFHQNGTLIKIKKGIYMYDPSATEERVLFDFSARDKKKILKRDNFRCVVCGLGKQDGLELVVDHIKPKDKGGTNSIDNGQTLCAQHNLIKKNYTQTEAGKRYFIKMYEVALANSDDRIVKFCESIFDVYNHHQVNGHIERPDKKSQKKQE